MFTFKNNNYCLEEDFLGQVEDASLVKTRVAVDNWHLKTKFHVEDTCMHGGRARS